MAKKNMCRLFLLLSIFHIDFALSQIYCAAEELFYGPVISVEERIYRQPGVFYGVFTDRDRQIDTFGLVERSIIEVANGRVTEKRKYGAKGDRGCACSKTYFANGMLMEKTTFNSNDKIDTRIVHKMDSNRLVRIDRYNQQGEIFSSTVYFHDTLTNTNVSKELFDDHEENIILTELNADNQPIKQYTVDNAGRRELFAINSYDSLKRTHVSMTWNADKTYYEHLVNEYDSLDRVIRIERYDSENKFLGSDSIVYDWNSNIVFNRSYDLIHASWSSYSYQYQYDQYNNFIIKEKWLVFQDEKILKERMVREYVYSGETDISTENEHSK